MKNLVSQFDRLILAIGLSALVLASCSFYYSTVREYAFLQNMSAQSITRLFETTLQQMGYQVVECHKDTGAVCGRKTDGAKKYGLDAWADQSRSLVFITVEKWNDADLFLDTLNEIARQQIIPVVQTNVAEAGPVSGPPMKPSVDTQDPVISKAIPESPVGRIALVIGNADYGKFGRLKNPINDAKDVASTLKRLQFSVVLLLNVGQEGMEHAIVEFGKRLKGGGVSLFYYAGHGMQMDGINFLIPVGAAIQSQKDVRYKAVDLGQILDEMNDARNALNIVILDACRDNPLPRSARSAGARGLTRVDAPRGVFIAFATSPGSVALDGNDRNSPFTKHLLENIRRPGLSLEQVFKRTLQGVDQETRGQQTPWSSSSFIGDFYFTE